MNSDSPSQPPASSLPPGLPPSLPPGHSPVSPTGILIIDKPLGPTSMDVCRRVRRALVRAGAPKRVKVGHGGTLDPLATGLLVVLVGKATPLCNQIMLGEKEYLTDIDLSAFSSTDDNEGIKTPIDAAAMLAPPDAQRVAAACKAFTGVIMQRPPAYSAIKVDGERAYDLARAGKPPELPARPVTINEIEVLAYAFPLLRLRIVCGKGTYIRSLARDIGASLNTGGYLTALRRTRTAHFHIESARRLDDLPQSMTQVDLLPVSIANIA